MAALGWTTYRDARSEARKQWQRREMIEVELSDRTVQLVASANIAELSSGPLEQQKYLIALHQTGFLGQPTTSTGGFPEFAGRSVSSLAWELATLDPTLRQKATELIAQLHFLRLLEGGPDLWLNNPTLAQLTRVTDEMNALRPAELQRAYQKALGNRLVDMARLKAQSR